MTTSEIVKTVANAFDISDNETILGHVAENVEWHLLGGPPIIGKEGMRKFFVEHNTKMLSSTRDNFIVEGNTVVINGEVSCLTADGTACNMFYCDIYEVEDGKIQKMTSYMIDKK